MGERKDRKRCVCVGGGGGGVGGLSYKLCQLRGLSSYELRYMHVGM